MIREIATVCLRCDAGNNVMLGAGAVILGDITIEDNSIIGANAVVTHNIPEKSLAVGSLARIKEL